jgi:hypothetical protein
VHLGRIESRDNPQGRLKHLDAGAETLDLGQQRLNILDPDIVAIGDLINVAVVFPD